MGLFLDPWQQFVLERSLGEKPDGRWAAFQVCLLCPRQNGKGSILEARELAGLFLFGEKKITHSAHEAKTAKDHFERMEALLRDAGYGDDLITYRRSTTEVSISVKATGCKLQFYTRTNEGGRGLVGDVVVLDEAYALTRDQMAALMPTMAARSLSGSPQMWFTSSAGFEGSDVLADKKAQGEAGSDRLAYFDWSADPGSSLTDREQWAKANPGLGLRISEDFVADELFDLGPERFGRERLGLWEDYKAKLSPITIELWDACAADVSDTASPSKFFVTIGKDYKSATIAAAAVGPYGPHVEIDYAPGVRWLTRRVRELKLRYPDAVFAAYKAGPLTAWEPEFRYPEPELIDQSVELEFLSQLEASAACAHLQKLAEAQAFTHPPNDVLSAAVQGARKRDLDGGGWVWDWKSSDGDLAPLAAVTGALWLLGSQLTALPRIF